MADARTDALSRKDIGETLPPAWSRSAIVNRDPYEDMEAEIGDRPAVGLTVRPKLIGILLCRPDSALARRELADDLPYLQTRSGTAIQLFFAGYGENWPPGHYADQTLLFEVGRQQWFFSDTAFRKVIADVERESKWKYSGETEFLLVPAEEILEKSEERVSFAYSRAVACRLDKMSGDKAFRSTRVFFEDLIESAASRQAIDPRWMFREGAAGESAAGALKDFVLSLLLEPLPDDYRKASSDAVRNVEADFS